MRSSDQAINVAMEEEIEDLLVQIISDLKGAAEAKILLSDLLTETERVAVAKRLAIALSLTNGKSYEEIKESLKVSSATIAKVQESLDSDGMKLAIEKVRIDDWAGDWAGKLAGAFGKLLGKSSP